MSIISSTTGHNRKQEEKIAGRLYFFIGLAVIVGMALYFFVGTHRGFDPYTPDQPARQEAPDSSAPGETTVPANPNTNPEAVPPTNTQ